VARATIRRALVEGVIDAPSPARSAESEDLCPLKALRPGLILPISVARVEPSSMRGKDAHFRAAHETASIIARPRQE
jgi:hypothetical protein